MKFYVSVFRLTGGEPHYFVEKEHLQPVHEVRATCVVRAPDADVGRVKTLALLATDPDTAARDCYLDHAYEFDVGDESPDQVLAVESFNNEGGCAFKGAAGLLDEWKVFEEKVEDGVAIEHELPFYAGAPVQQ